LTEDVVLYAYP